MVAGTTATVAVVLGLLPLLESLYAHWLGEGNQVTWQHSVKLSLAVAASTLLVAGLVALWSLRRMPPRDFAQVAIGGQTASQVFRTIAYEMICIAHRFDSDLDVIALNAEGEKLKGLSDEAINDYIIKLLPTIEERTAALTALILGQQHILQRILEMKQMAAELLGISERRLCDHVFRFSPLVFSDRARKYVENWEEIVVMSRSVGTRNDPDRLFVARIRARLAENEQVHEQLSWRMEYMKEVMAYRDLHSFIYRCASERSASTALRSYALAVSQVARFGGFVNDPSWSHPALVRVSQRLRFLVQAQRAHPGFDLHRTCQRLLKLAINRKTANAQGSRETEERQAEVLKRLEQGRVHRGKAPFEQQTVQDDAIALARLFEVVSLEIDRSRAEIATNFGKLYERWRSRQPQMETLIITHGYSKTVRGVLERTIFANQDLARRTRVFVMHSDAGRGGPRKGTRDALDTRVMEYELRYGGARKSGAERLSSGDEVVLRSLLPNATRVLVLLGAECFDQSRRVVHPQGVAERLLALRGGLEGRFEYWFAVVAEGYKMQKNLIDDRAFYQDHLDWVSVYPEKLIDTVISDDSIVDETGSSVIGDLPRPRRDAPNDRRLDFDAGSSADGNGP